MHQNLAFRFNSQPLAAAFTTRKSLGGSAWPNLNFSDDRFEYAYCLWANSTLGLVTFWWNSNRQQSGRGVVTIRSVEAMPILDMGRLSDKQLRAARDAFEDFREMDLMPAYLADIDPNRERLDQALLCGVLGFDIDVFRAVRRLTEKWCAEPSVHGGKREITQWASVSAGTTLDALSRRTGGGAKPTARHQAQQIYSSSRALFTTCWTVKPKCSITSPPGAEAPNSSMPTCSPSDVVYRSQPIVVPASTDTLASMYGGKTESRYSAG